MRKRAVLYARVSSDDRGREGRNLAGQLEMCRDFALQNGWTIVAELSEDDRGASGASFELPELNRARDMAQNKEFDVLVVRELDRLSRKLAKQLIVEEQLNRAGVEVAYVMASYENSPEGRLNKHIRATIAEYEREKIAERMVRGRRQVVRNGKIMLHGNKPPFGYHMSSDGANLEIFEPEAMIVRLIYTLYVDGDESGRKLSLRKIAERLTKMNVPTWADSRVGMFKKRAKGEWSGRLVQRILMAETYAGTWHYGKRNATNYKINPPEYHLTLNVPAIVSRDVWERAQLQRKANFTESTRNLKRNYLLRSRVRCGHCNASVNCYATVNNGNEAKAYFYYRCNGVMGNIANVTCNLPSFRVDIVDKLVWDWIKLLLTDDAVLENGLKLYTENQEELLAPLRDRMAVLDDLLRDTKSQLDRVIDLYVAGDIPRDILVDKKQRLETTLSALSEERQQLLAHMQGKALNEKDLQKIRNFAAQVADGLDLDELDFEGRRRLVEMLDVHAKFFIEDDQKVVEIWCILGTGELPVMNNSDHQMGSNSLPFMNPSFRSAARATGYRRCSEQSHRRPRRTYRRAPWPARRGRRFLSSSGVFPARWTGWHG